MSITKIMVPMAIRKIKAAVFIFKRENKRSVPYRDIPQEKGSLFHAFFLILKCGLSLWVGDSGFSWDGDGWGRSMLLVSAGNQESVQIKTIITPVRMAIIREQTEISVGKDVEKLKCLCMASRIQNVFHCGRQLGKSSKGLT